MDGEDQMSLTQKIAAWTNSLQELPDQETRKKLIFLINEMITHDFNALIQFLYRIDINENKLKDLLVTHADKDAAAIIADLIITRQLEKAASRNQYRNKGNAGYDESW